MNGRFVRLAEVARDLEHVAERRDIRRTSMPIEPYDSHCFFAVTLTSGDAARVA